MARWHVIPVLGTVLFGGAAQAYFAPDATLKPRLEVEQRGYLAQAPVYGGAVPTPVAPGYVAPSYPSSAPPQRAPTGLRPSPRDPYAGVTLPRQSGDAAYQGGGVVLEQDESGVNRRVR